MDKIKKSVLVVAILLIVVLISGYAKKTSINKKDKEVTAVKTKEDKTINFFVTHGHCSTPFAGVVTDLELYIPVRSDLGNPLENMQVSFQVDPNTFNVCRAQELNERIRKPGLFIGENNEKVTFKSTNIYTMGIDWYQINGIMSIKGVEKEAKLFATGIRKTNEATTSELVLQGQMNLFDWGIDYDLIVNGKSDTVPTKWLYLNMKIKV
ncbi:MAG: YceI family protein [Tenacibaculum sp.]